MDAKAMMGAFSSLMTLAILVLSYMRSIGVLVGSVAVLIPRNAAVLAVLLCCVAVPLLIAHRLADVRSTIRTRGRR